MNPPLPWSTLPPPLYGAAAVATDLAPGPALSLSCGAPFLPADSTPGAAAASAPTAAARFAAASGLSSPARPGASAATWPAFLWRSAHPDVVASIMPFSKKGPRSVCVLFANGTISNVALNQPGSSVSNFTYEGRFEILQLSASFTVAEEDGRRRSGGFCFSLAGPNGRVIGGVVVGMLCAASPIQANGKLKEEEAHKYFQ